MSIIRLCCCMVLGLIWCQAHALIPTGCKQRLTAGWEFIRQDMGNIWEVMRPISGSNKPETVPLWEKVSLPHCFNAEDAVDPDCNYYQGPGWYRTRLTLANPYPDGRIYLEFEGAGQKSDVYVYTQKVASHVGGYDEWKVDITEAVEAFRKLPVCQKRFGGQVPIAIRCDNSRDTELIPSDLSDFNLYGGLYRYVNLVYVPAIHPENIRIHAEVDDAGKQGKLSVTIGFNGWECGRNRDCTRELKRIPVYLTWRLFNPAGCVIQTLNKQLQEFPSANLPDHALNNQPILLITDTLLRKPQLWSPDYPQLYTAQIELTCGTDTLRTTERFGFRHFRFEENGPFYLNGKRLLLRGTHRHEDHAGVGAAMTEDMMRQEMRQIKDMGANFIRLGHYQQSDIILQLCDELGLLVWEEIPWCRGGLGGPAYRMQARRMLTHMIEQHRNHPSIILWGLGNENDWPGDFEHFHQDSIRSFMKELHRLAHQLDDTRLTVIRRCDFCKDIVDVYSPSIWAGWYSRRFRDYAGMEADGMKSIRRFIHAEWGGDSHAGRHAEEVYKDHRSSFDIEAGDRNGDWSESYIVRLFDWHLKEQEKMPWLTGSAFWTFKDFSTPLRPQNPIPYVNQKGVVQRDGTPKESYYVFQSYWSAQPMLHIYGHTWPVRWGKPQEPKEVLVYSNCPEVELFVNGQSQGKKKRNSQDFPAAGYHWMVALNEGENTIEAVARQGKLCLRDTIHPVYQTLSWEEPVAIRLTQTRVDDERIRIQAEIVDQNGIRCLDNRSFIRFGCTHPQALIQHQGSAHGSRRVQAANGVAVIYVKAQAAPVAVSATNEQYPHQSALITGMRR